MAAPPPATPGLYDSKGPQVVAVIILMPTLAFIIVALRFYTRIFIVRNLAWDDWFAGLAIVMSILTSIAMGFQVMNGMGRHIATLTMQQGINSLKALFASITTYNFGLTFAKLSILLQYRRICANKVLMRIIYLLMGIVILYSAWCFFSGIFNCVPVKKFWMGELVEGHCIPEQFLWFFNAGCNIAIDFSLVALPFFLLKDLMLPRRQKYTLIAILGLGGFASVMSILRLYALYIVSISKDITWDNPGTAIWSSVELNTGIMCASLPALRAMLSRFFPNIFPSRAASNGPSHEASGGSRSRGIKRFSKMSSSGRRGPNSSGFGTLSDEDGFYDAKGELESGDRSPDSVRMMPLASRGAATGRLSGPDEKRLDAFIDSSSETGMTALPITTYHHNHSSNTESSANTFDQSRIATPPLEGIRVITSMRQTVEDRPQRLTSSPIQPVGMGAGGRWGSVADRDVERREMMLGRAH